MLGQMLGQLATMRGEPCTIRVRVGETYSPTTGNSYTTSDVVLRGLIRHYATSDIGGADGMVQAGDREITIDAAQFPGALPSNSSRIVVNSEEQEVLRRWTIKAGGLHILVLYHVRGTS